MVNYRASWGAPPICMVQGEDELEAFARRVNTLFTGAEVRREASTEA